MKRADNVKLKANQRVMPFTHRDVIKKAKEMKPHFSAVASLCFYTSFQESRIKFTRDAREIFLVEQELKLIKLIADGTAYANKFVN